MVRRKRDNGDGSLFLSHGRWRGYLSLDTGRRKYFKGCSRAEVQKKLREARRALEHGDESCLRLHVVPSSLGKRQLSQLRAENIENWLAHLKAGGLGGARRQTLLKMLRVGPQSR